MSKQPNQRQRERAFRSSMRRLVSPDAHRWAMPVIALVMLIGIIAGAIWVSSITRQHVHLDDGTVWVTSLKNRKAARFNVKLKEPDSAVASSAARFDIVQHDSDTVLTEGAKATGISSATLGTTGRTETKGDTTAVTGGGTIAFLNTKNGNVWVGRSSDLNSVNPATSDPSMRLGTGGKIAVTHDGTVYGYRPSDGTVLTMQDPTGKAVQGGSLTEGKTVSADDFTVVDGTAVVTSEGRLYWHKGSADTGANSPLTLQYPDTDGRQESWVAAAGKNGLYLVELGKGEKKVNTLTSGGAGDAAKPVSTDGCVSAAWAQSANNYVRVCSPNVSNPEFGSLQSVSATSDLVFRTNHRLTVLNDVVDGNVWNPSDSTKVIKIQWNTIQTEQTAQQKQNDQSANNQRNFNKTCSAQSGQIKAQDDEIGARAGGQQILDVLRNDEQTDCSVLQITKVGAPAGGDMTVSPVYDGRYLQLDASAASAGTVTFTYDISDGRGQTSTAKVTVTLTGSSANHAPKQADTPPEYDVEQGATYTTNALGSFQDPDGDPMTLVSAVPQNSDQVVVSTRADGQLVFNTGSATSGRVGVQVTVSDGQNTGTGLVYFSIRPANTLPATIDAVVKQTTPNTETTVNLKPYVHGTSAQPAQLSTVEPPAKTSATMNAADLSFTFKATATGTYYVPYTVTQGSIPSTGLARLEVQPAAGKSAKPVAANDVALLGSNNTAIVEPLANDVDPMGGVLSVTSVDADPSLGIKTGLVSHKRVYLTARQVPTKPVEITYTVANAAGSSTGTIVLQPPALTAGNSAPKASNVNTQVRTDGIVSVNVLDHVSHSDGTTVTLQQKLQYDKDTFKGLVFVSGDTVRYQASKQTGVFPVTYTVKDNLGNSASGTITITVHQKDAKNKAAPTPQDVEAQVAAGQKVRIPITLTGIDVDGDDDQLLGLGNKAPQLGRITEVGANYMIYEAYEDSSGTDTFSYAVEDWTGQRAQAQVRVGVFQGASDSGVYARDDEITLRPHTAATVPVTLNDISGDNTDLTVSKKLESQGISGASVKDNMISFTTPDQAGTFYIMHTVADKAGLSDTATLTVNVDPNATIEPPTAYDYRVPSAATIDKRTVEVDVSQWIANPSGTANELKVGVDPSATDHAKVKGGEKSTVISVDLTDEARSVPYTVTNTTYGITSTAFIQVPAYGVFPPTLRPKAPPLKVNSRETITINIADYVRVGAGKTAYVDGADSVSATKAADGDLYVNDQTLRFTAPKDYAGPASITFTAVDGKRDKNDKVKIVNSAVLTLPITVIGREVPPPTFSSSTVDVVAGEKATTIDLTALTHSASSLYEDEKQYSYSGGVNSGSVDARVSPSGTLTVSADKTATPGTTVSVPVSIKYAKGTVSAGMTVRVTASNRPLARVTEKTVKIKAGSSEQVNLLSDAYNPFPDTPLTVTGCTSDGASKLTVDCPSNGVVSIRAASDIGASTNKVVVTVRDATKTKEREVTGTISVSVMDKPDAPLLSAVSGDPQDGAVNLSWTAGSANGSPITEYKVMWGGDASGERSCGQKTSCLIDGLKNGKTYSFKVQARNEVGWSKDSNAVEGTPDKLPDAPTDVTASVKGNTVSVTWKAPDGNFSSVDNYEVTLSGRNAPSKQTTNSTGINFVFDNNAISDGDSYTATVRAHNKVNWSQPSKASDAVKPWGKPDAPKISVTNDDTTGTVTVESVGNTRNAGCKAVEISGDVSASIDGCSGSYDFKIPDHDLNTREYTIKAAVVGKEKTTSDDSIVRFTPKYTVKAPESVSVKGHDDVCVVSWKENGHADGFTVSADGLGSYHAGASERSHDFPLKEWQSCSSGSVTQHFNGAASTSKSGRADPAYVRKVKAAVKAPMLTWDANDPNIIKVSGGSVNMYGQPGKTVITFTADGKSYDVAWALGSDKLNVKDVLPTGADYAWKAKVVGTDTALNNEDNGGTLLDHDRYKTPTPKPEPSEPSEPSKPSEPSDSDASTEGEAATRNDRPVASSVALSTVDGASKPWIRGLAYYARW